MRSQLVPTLLDMSLSICTLRRWKYVCDFGARIDRLSCIRAEDCQHKIPEALAIRGLGKGSSIALIRSAAKYSLKRYAVVGLRRIKGSEGVY